MNFSKNIASLKPSSTVALNAKAKALQAKGINVYNFTVGEPHFPTPQKIVDIAIESLKNGKTKYGPAGGSLPFRKVIQEKLSRENSLEFLPDQIVAGTGSKEILFHIFLAILNEGDEVLIPSPYWVSYREQVLAAGGTPKILPLENNWIDTPLSIKSLEEYTSDKTVAILLNYPNNPSGRILNQSIRKQLGEFLQKKDWWIISDEIYEYLSYDEPHVSLLESFPQLKDRFILVNGLSKSFAMTGWRVGYCAAPIQLAKLIKSIQSHSSTCIPPFIEDAAIVALQEGVSLMTSQIEYLKDMRQRLVTLLKQFPHISFVPPQGAFYIFVDLSKQLQSSHFNTSGEISEWLLEKYKIATVPGDAFGADNFLRLSYATDWDYLNKGVLIFAEALAELS